MGFEKNAAALFLRIRSEGIKLGRVVTLGHQRNYLSAAEYDRVLEKTGRARTGSVPEFADDLFLAMGADKVEAIDASSYEGAQLLCDLNRPIPGELHERYDVVFDGGTLEHIFDFPTAIKNCMRMTKRGGHFVSVTVPNNWCGHGFYQFSPELFYRIFSANNGFSVKGMFMAELDGRAYAVQDPALLKSRVELCNKRPVFLLLYARRDSVVEIFKEPPQQSDYVTGWSANGVTSAETGLQKWKNLRVFNLWRRLRTNVLLYRRRKDCSLTNEVCYKPVDLQL